jgi:type IV pilus biogenesis protein CpaD/CtpE
MRSKAVLALAMALLACGCASKSKCPTPVNYDAKTLKEIEKAREALPKDSILHQVLEDYENERDDLRFCR